jgi:cyclopropane fatty-acyl-phospholipid synthase-like methyltransferase
MPDWNQLFTNEENRWEQSYGEVVDYLSKGGLKKGELILDLGCGAGRHLAYLEENSRKCIGMDVAWNGLNFSKSKLQNANLPFALVQAEMSDDLPFPDDCFDHVISIHVIFHNTRKKVQETIKEIKRVLKTGGTTLLTFNATYSTRFGHGVEIENDTWIPDIGIDKGIPHHFSTLEDVVGLMQDFKVMDIHLEEQHFNDGVSSHWVVIAQKEK